MVRDLKSKSELVALFTITHFRDRHRGQILGTIWPFVYPLLLVLFLALLFTAVFPARSQGVGNLGVLTVMAGFLAWLPISDLLNRSSQILEQNRALIKQIAFPFEVLPMATTLTVLLPFLPSVLFVALWSGISGNGGRLVWIFPALLAQMTTMLGISLFLSVIGLAVRDLREVTAVFTFAGLFLLPILYQPSAMPEVVSLVIYVNPFSYLVWAWQLSLGDPGPVSYGAPFIAMLIGALSLLVGSAIFARGKRILGDVL